MNIYINTCFATITFIILNILLLNNVMNIQFDGIWKNNHDTLYIKYTNNSICEYTVNLNGYYTSWCFSKSPLYGALYFIPRYDNTISPPDWQIVNINKSLVFGEYVFEKN